MLNDHGSHRTGDHAVNRTAPASALANAVATVTTAGPGFVGRGRFTPTEASRVAHRSGRGPTLLDLEPICRNTFSHRPLQRISGLAICLTLVLHVGAGSPATALASRVDPTECCTSPTYHPERRIDPTNGRPGAVAADAGPPDDVADYVGGIAARLRRTDETPVAGRLYVLMATVGSDERARLYEQTPFTHDNGAHADTIESNERAVEAAESITGVEVEQIEFTTAPGGGPSAGLIYLIAYLNVISHGAFTADVNVAATGELDAEGYIGHVRGVDEKLGAAHLAGADVFFAPSAPSHPKLAEHAARRSGYVYRSRYGRATLASERGLDDYETWGADRPKGLDVVEVGHIADVAAYLCGAASEYACSIVDLLGATITSDTLTAYDIVRAAHTPSAGPTLGDPSLGALQ